MPHQEQHLPLEKSGLKDHAVRLQQAGDAAAAHGGTYSWERVD